MEDLKEAIRLAGVANLTDDVDAVGGGEVDDGDGDEGEDLGKPGTLGGWPDVGIGEGGKGGAPRKKRLGRHTFSFLETRGREMTTEIEREVSTFQEEKKGGGTSAMDGAQCVLYLISKGRVDLSLLVK